MLLGPQQGREKMLKQTFRTAERGPRSSQCAHAARETKASFHDLYFCCLGKHSQTETGFKTKLPSDEGRQLDHFLLRWFDVQIVEKYDG